MRFFNRSNALGFLVVRLVLLGGLGGYFAWRAWGEFLRSGHLTVDAFFAAFCGVILIGVLRTRPPVLCEGCGARGWRRDLDPGNPVCPCCGHSRFTVFGRFKGECLDASHSVSGAILFSPGFLVRRESGGDGGCADGGWGGDCGGDGCGGGD